MINDRSWIAGSANAAVVVSIRTSKPSTFSQPLIIEAQRSGSCPGQPPHTIIALRILQVLVLNVFVSVDQSGDETRRQRGRALHGGFEFDAASLVRGDLER